MADFSGGRLSGDNGALLLRQVDAGLSLSRALSRCFVDHRRADLIEHSVEELLRQRLQRLALGYEDLNDHRELRRDPLLAATAGKVDVLGQERLCPEHRGFALANPATLNRLELSAEFSDYYCFAHKNIPRKPDAGNLHVRFDEGRGGCGHWPCAFHPAPPLLLYRNEPKSKNG